MHWTGAVFDFCFYFATNIHLANEIIAMDSVVQYNLFIFIPFSMCATNFWLIEISGNLIARTFMAAFTRYVSMK